MKVGGQILWNVTPICEASQINCLMGRRPMKDVLGNHLGDQDLLSDGKSPCERRFGVPFNGPVIPFGAMVEYYLVSAKDHRDCISSARKSYQEILRLCVIRGENLARRHFGRRP